MTETLPGIGKIHSAIAAIMGEVGGVGKTRENKQQGYRFRGIADIKLACQSLLAKHQVHLTPHSVLHEEVTERQTKAGAAMIHIRQRIEFRFYHADGSYFPCVTTGEAMDTGDKASNKCMSAAMKYALDQVFCLPEEDPDADTESKSPEIAATRSSVGKPLPSPTPADMLTDAEVASVHAAAKLAGYGSRNVLAPVLHNICGVNVAAAIPRAELKNVLEALAQLPRAEVVA
jgi:hypothetical protein